MKGSFPTQAPAHETGKLAQKRKVTKMTEKTHNNDLTGPVPGSAGVEANIENMEAMGLDPENLDMILNGT